MNGMVLAVILGSLAYLVWSMRRLLRSLRAFLQTNTGEGTVTSRLMPNLAFGALFLLLVNQTLLVDLYQHLGIPKGFRAFGTLVDVRSMDDPFFAIHDLGANGNRTQDAVRAITVTHGGEF